MRIENVKTTKYPIYYCFKKEKLKSVLLVPDEDFRSDQDDHVFLSLYINDKKIFDAQSSPELGVQISKFKQIPLLLEPIDIYDDDVVYLSVIKHGDDLLNFAVFTWV